MFIDNEADQDMHKDDAEPAYKIKTGWDTLQFFIFVVIIEHVILVLKLVRDQITSNKISTKI